MEARFVEILESPEYTGLITGVRKHPLLASSIREIGRHLYPQFYITDDFVKVFVRKMSAFCKLWWAPSGGSYEQFTANLMRLLPSELTERMLSEAEKVAHKGIVTAQSNVPLRGDFSPRVEKAIQTLKLFASLEYLVAEVLDAAFEILSHKPIPDDEEDDEDYGDEDRPEGKLTSADLVEAFRTHPEFASIARL